MAEFPSRRQLLLLTLLVEGGLGVVGCVLGFWVGHPPWAIIHWDWDEVLFGLAATLPLLALFFACLRWPVGPLGRIKRFADEVIRPLFSSCTILDLAVIGLIAGIGEELFFRGFLQPWLVESWGPWAGIAAASVIFGLFHPITRLYAVWATLVGVGLGILAYWRENLLAAILAHGLYDFVALWVLVASRSADSFSD
jgi:uncharacterized protein